MAGSSQTARTTPCWELRIVEMWLVFVRWLWAFLSGGLATVEPARMACERWNGPWQRYPDLPGNGWLNVPVVLETWFRGHVRRAALACAPVRACRDAVTRHRSERRVSLLRSTSCAPATTWDFPRPVSGWN